MGRTARILIIAAVVAAVVIALGLKNRGGAPDNGPSTVSALPKLVDLGADKCIPCRMMAPILEELKIEFSGRLEVEFIDVWKDRSMAGKYGISSIPTQIFYDSRGRELYRHVGFISKADILGKWGELGYSFR